MPCGESSNDAARQHTRVRLVVYVETRNPGISRRVRVDEMDLIEIQILSVQLQAIAGGSGCGCCYHGDTANKCCHEQNLLKHLHCAPFRSDTTGFQPVDFKYDVFYTGKQVKLTAKVKLLRDSGTSDLLYTLNRANGCCEWISGQAWKTKTFGTFALHRLTYAKAREHYGLAAQMVVRCIGKVADAYKLDKKKRRTFDTHGAFPYDDRILSWNIPKRQVSIWTVAGRKRMEFVAGERQLALLAHRQGETDLIYHKGNFYLAATCNVDEPDPGEVDEFLGVDLGVANIASTSDGKNYSGAVIKGVRYRHRRLRTKLQRKQTRSAKRKLKELCGKESRFATHTNHCIAKDIVETSRRTGRGIAVEDLTGIRARIRARRNQRAVLHSWAFAQLREFLTYKAALAGVRLVTVDPRNSSRECSACGYTEKLNRPSQSSFSCRRCGHSENADLNAARVIAGRGDVNRPNAPRSRFRRLSVAGASPRLSAEA